VSDDSAFPEFYEWDTDGNELEGAYVAFTSIPTKVYGEKPALILHVGTADRTIPLWDTALGNRFRDEIARRPDGDLVPGERVLIRRGGMVDGANGYKYRAYKVVFPDAPKRSPKDILGAHEAGTEPAVQTPPAGEPDTEQIPF
jgi:hypothetical protein